MLYRKEFKMTHRDEEVQAAITRLSDALCTYERATSIKSVLIIREEGGFEYRALSGKPVVPDDISDKDLLDIIGLHIV
jgi:hypothetical protein